MVVIFIVAHTPLASSLRACALHVFPDSANQILTLDVLPDEPPEQTLKLAKQLMQSAGQRQVLVLSDLFGSTPCNVAKQVVDGINSKLVAGVNLPMLLRALTYCQEDLDTLVARAVAGGNQGILHVAVTAPQHQSLRIHDQQDHHNQ